jgi:hypothetical protein
MNRELLTRVLESPSDDAIQALFDDEDTIFWVDWREEDDAIVQYCEARIQTGSLSAEVVEVDTDDGFEIYINYKNKRVKVPLTYSLQDRHITICSLNEILSPDYEIRFCIDSKGSDTLAFLPLSSSDWSDLERRHGDAVSQRFCRIAASPNLFNEPLP